MISDGRESRIFVVVDEIVGFDTHSLDFFIILLFI